MADNQESRTPNRDKWFKKHAHRGMEVPETKYGNDAPRTPTPTPTTATSIPPRPTPPSDRS